MNNIIKTCFTAPATREAEGLGGMIQAIHDARIPNSVLAAAEGKARPVDMCSYFVLPILVELGALFLLVLEPILIIGRIITSPREALNHLINGVKSIAYFFIVAVSLPFIVILGAFCKETFILPINQTPTNQIAQERGFAAGVLQGGADLQRVAARIEELEDALRDAEEEINELREELAGVVPHDVQNDLQALVQQVEDLQAQLRNHPQVVQLTEEKRVMEQELTELRRRQQEEIDHLQSAEAIHLRYQLTDLRKQVAARLKKRNNTIQELEGERGRLREMLEERELAHNRELLEVREQIREEIRGEVREEVKGEVEEVAQRRIKIARIQGFTQGAAAKAGKRVGTTIKLDALLDLLNVGDPRNEQQLLEEFMRRAVARQEVLHAKLAEQQGRGPSQ